MVCEYRGGGGVRREAKQAERAASVAAAEEAASAEANEAARTAKSPQGHLSRKDAGDASAARLLQRKIP